MAAAGVPDIATPLDLYAVVRERLTDQRFQFYDVVVPATPPGAYVVGYPTAGVARPDRLVGRHSRVQFDIRLVCVGRSPAQCLNTVQIVRDLLLDWRPDPAAVVADRLAEVDNAASLIADETNLIDVRYSYTLQFRLHTARRPQQ